MPLILMVLLHITEWPGNASCGTAVFCIQPEPELAGTEVRHIGANCGHSQSLSLLLTTFGHS